MVQPGWRIAVALSAGLLCAGTAWADGGDPAERIRAEALRLVPSPWRVEDIVVEPLRLPIPPGAPENARAGDARMAARVSLRIALAKPTFLVESREGTITFVRPAAEPSLEKTLTATATATRSGAGTWTVRAEPNNPEVLEAVGTPADELPGRVVLIGSEEERLLRDELRRLADQRLAEAEARRHHEEELLARQAAAAKAETARIENESRLIEARAAQIAGLRSKLLGDDRAAKIAGYEAALGGNDAALRRIAVEAALQSRDPVLANLALRDWLARKRQVPVQLFATKEDRNSETVLHNLGPLTLEIDSFNRVDGAVTGKMGAPGYGIAMPSAAAGALAQTELTVQSYGCALNLRLTEHQTLDGLFRCQTLPPLIARITLD